MLRGDWSKVKNGCGDGVYTGGPLRCFPSRETPMLTAVPPTKQRSANHFLRRFPRRISYSGIPTVEGATRMLKVMEGIEESYAMHHSFAEWR